MRERSWSEGRDGDHVAYRERLAPPIAVNVLALGLAVVVGVAYGAAYGAALGWIVGGAIGVLAIALLALTTVPLRVDDRVVRAGRARLPLHAVASVEALDPAGMVQARRHGDPRDYLVLRAWSSRRGVAIVLADSRDPHPRWIVTSRRPEQFAAAIEQARMQAQGPSRGE